MTTSSLFLTSERRTVTIPRSGLDEEARARRSRSAGTPGAVGPPRLTATSLSTSTGPVSPHARRAARRRQPRPGGARLPRCSDSERSFSVPTTSNAPFASGPMHSATRSSHSPIPMTTSRFWSRPIASAHGSPCTDRSRRSRRDHESIWISSSTARSSSRRKPTGSSGSEPHRVTVELPDRRRLRGRGRHRRQSVLHRRCEPRLSSTTGSERTEAQRRADAMLAMARASVSRGSEHRATPDQRDHCRHPVRSRHHGRPCVRRLARLQGPRRHRPPQRPTTPTATRSSDVRTVWTPRNRTPRRTGPRVTSAFARPTTWRDR